MQTLDHGDRGHGRDLRIEVRAVVGFADAPDEGGDHGGQDLLSHTPDVVALDLGLGPCPDHRAVVDVHVAEAAQPPAQLAVAGLVGADGAEGVRERGHLLGHVDQQRSEEILFVGEVEIEGAMRRASHLDDVVDARRVVAALLEHGHRRVEQLAHGLLALGAQLALLGRGAAPRRKLSAGSGGHCYGRLLEL